jgi:hypothetical protein
MTGFFGNKIHELFPNFTAKIEDNDVYWGL